MPGNTVIKFSDNGSIGKAILVAAVKNMNTFVQQFVQKHSYILGLDGHASGKGVE